VDEYLSEKEQWEWIKSQLRSLLPWVVLTAVLILGGSFGWKEWQKRQEAQAVAAGTKYEQILTAFEKNERTRALTLLGELTREHPQSPYVDQARLMEAKLAVQDEQLDKAATILQQIMTQNRDLQLAVVARLRLARVQLAQNKPDVALTTLNAAQSTGAFVARFQEVRGDVYAAKGDTAAALKEYRAARESTVRGAVDTQWLDLKINDLSNGTPAVVKK
jgi:predicted negative regulator of RcsB-dependent stress response